MSDTSSSVMSNDNDGNDKLLLTMLFQVGMVCLLLIALLLIRFLIWCAVQLLHVWLPLEKIKLWCNRFLQMFRQRRTSPNNNDDLQESNDSSSSSSSSDIQHRFCNSSVCNDKKNLYNYYHMLVELILPGKVCTAEDYNRITGGMEAVDESKSAEEARNDDNSVRSSKTETTESQSNAPLDEDEESNTVSSKTCYRRRVPTDDDEMNSASASDAIQPSRRISIAVVDEAMIDAGGVDYDEYLDRIEAGETRYDDRRDDFDEVDNSCESDEDGVAVATTISIREYNGNANDCALPSMNSGEIPSGILGENNRSSDTSFVSSCSCDGVNIKCCLSDNDDVKHRSSNNDRDVPPVMDPSSISLHHNCYFCSICLQEIEIGDNIYSTRHCNHTYHTNCIRQWVTSGDSCYNNINQAIDGNVNNIRNLMASFSFNGIIKNNDCPNCRTPLFFARK